MEHKAEFDKLLGVSIPIPTFQLLAKGDFSPYLEAMTSQVLTQFFNQGVVSSRNVLQPPPKQILVRRLPSKKETLERPPFSFLELDEGRKSAAGYCRENAVEVSPADRWLVCDLTQYLLVPNVSPNWAETQERQQAKPEKIAAGLLQGQNGARCSSGKVSPSPPCTWRNCRPRASSTPAAGP